MLEAIGISKSYRGHAALSTVSLTLSAGECLGLAGHNGSGKSTLLAILAQVTRPDTGEIREDGKDVRGDRTFLRRAVGYVPQRDALMEDITVGEHLKLWKGLCGVRGGLPPTLLELLGLEGLLDQRIARLSGGMKKRVSIALALLGKPRYLLMDEAFSGLDEAYRGALTAWLLDFVKEGGGLIWCSHEPDELRVLCSRVMMLQDGAVVQ